jgi:hypothetical protein
MRIKKAVANLGILLASLVVGLLLCEAASRIVLDPVDYLSPSIVRDDILGIAIPPRSGGHDEWGFRNKAVPRSADIVTLGDSHTYGNAAKMTESWPFVLGRISGRSVYNLGLGGYGPNQYLYLLKNRALRLKPRVIVCGFWMGDEFDNALKITYGLDYWKSLRSPELAGQARTWDIWEQPAATSWHKKVRVWLSSNSMVYRLLVHGLFDNLRGRAQIQAASRPGDPTPILRQKGKGILEAFYRPGDVLTGLDQEDPGVKEGMRISFEIIHEMDRLCRDNGIIFVVAVIPTKEFVFSDYLGQDPGIPSKDIIEKLILNESAARKALFSYLDGVGIRYVDTLPQLRQAVEKQKLYANGFDTHPNKNGYRIIAEAVAGFISENPLPPRR